VDLAQVDREVDALDDLGAVLERDVQVLDLEQCQLGMSFLAGGSQGNAPADA
jgi:hypothetical protein